ncbi:nuclear transport factor 2 family protein [Taklimakanibacter deserti]|uniref:nuclear transport factor 2 family protein n=1 Tax=Taklimakanibacter deserti TaxID=2267839 RepID=UPI0013C45D8B
MKTDLTTVVQSYLDALFHGDVALFRKVFHPEARLFSATGGALVALDLEQYMEIVKGRPSPAARKDERRDEIVSIVQASATTAHARLKNAYLPKRFTDDLTLIHIDGAWRIIAKVWHFDIV